MVSVVSLYACTTGTDREPWCLMLIERYEEMMFQPPPAVIDRPRRNGKSYSRSARPFKFPFKFGR